MNLFVYQRQYLSNGILKQAITSDNSKFHMPAKPMRMLFTDTYQICAIPARVQSRMNPVNEFD